MNKVMPKISGAGSIRMPSGSRNTDVGRHATGGTLARVKGSGTSPSGSSGPAGSFMPDRKPQAGLANQRTGQPNPETGAAATTKPKRRGIGAAFYGEYT